MLIFKATQLTTCTKANCTTPGGRTWDYKYQASWQREREKEGAERERERERERGGKREIVRQREGVKEGERGQKRGRGGRERKRERERERERGRRSEMFAIIRNFMVSVRRTGTFLVTLYIKNTFSGEVTGSCWLFSSHFSYAWIEMKNQLLTFPNKGITLQQLSTL